MFSNLHWTNVVIILLLALFIFGDKLPNMIVEGLRMLRKLRQLAQNATTDLSRELGTEITLEDLHPKTFIRKHVLTEADQEAMLRPLKDFENDFKRVGKEADEVVGEMNGRGATRRPRTARPTSPTSPTSPAPAASAVPSQPVAAEPARAPEEAPAAPVSYEDLP